MKANKLTALDLSVGRSLTFFLFFFLVLFNSSASAGRSNSGSIGTTVVPTAVGHLVVLQVIKDSPADRKGILPGDLIVEVNGFDLKGSDFNQVVKEQLWGIVGTDIDLKILRPGKEGLTALRLTRAKLTEKPEELPGVKMVLPKEENQKSP